MKRVLMISPHFPPDASAATHRVRVLAPYLEANGWRPTVLTVRPEDYAGRVDPELARMVPSNLEVYRASAMAIRWTRLVGFGDLGLRALPGLRRAVRGVLTKTPHHAVFITTYPIYPAVLGPWARRRFGVPFVLDFQDPWVGEWGSSVGGGPNGHADLKSRVSRKIARHLERSVVPHVDALTGVSSALLAELTERFTVLRGKPRVALPIGIDLGDFDFARHSTAMRLIHPEDGTVDVSYVGTLLPLAFDTLTALFQAVKRLRDSDEALVSRLRMHFVGTSNQPVDDARPVVLDRARAAGLHDLVTEHPSRVGYVAALQTMLNASILLVLGSTERRYTASKLAPVVASGRPLLVVAHRDSDICSALRRMNRTALAAVTFDDRGPGPHTVDEIYRQLRDWIRCPPSSRPVTRADLADLSGPEIARRFAELLNNVTAQTNG